MESLGSESKIKCDHCSSYQVRMYVHQHVHVITIRCTLNVVTGTKWLRIRRLPIITCFHLKASRYCHSIFKFIKFNLSLQRFEHSQKFRKINKPIKFPLEIDMTSYLANRLDILGIAEMCVQCNPIVVKMLHSQTTSKYVYCNYCHCYD